MPSPLTRAEAAAAATRGLAQDDRGGQGVTTRASRGVGAAVRNRPRPVGQGRDHRQAAEDGSSTRLADRLATASAQNAPESARRRQPGAKGGGDWRPAPAGGAFPASPLAAGQTGLGSKRGRPAVDRLLLVNARRASNRHVPTGDPCRGNAPAFAFPPTAVPHTALRALTWHRAGRPQFGLNRVVQRPTRRIWSMRDLARGRPGAARRTRPRSRPPRSAR
jgi:hypothetical protein